MAEDNATSGGKITFTDGESTILMSIIKHMTSDIQFDADAVAAELGYKDGQVVKTRWGQIKRKKLGAGATASPGSGGIKKRTPAKKATPKKAKEGGDAAGDDSEVEKSPTKTPKKRGGRKSKAEIKAEEDAKVEENGIKEEEMEEAVESTE